LAILEPLAKILVVGDVNKLEQVILDESVARLVELESAVQLDERLDLRVSH
jgi:hypothetical protein